jgi:tRNA(Ile)-lysidine synthase
LQTLPDTRIDHVLRYWIAAHHRKMPSTARLAEMRRQLMTARDDARVSVRHGDMEVHRYRQQLSIASCVSQAPSNQPFVWNGESSMAFPAFAGTLCIVAAAAGEPGVRRDWLMGRQLEMRQRQGGERLKLAANRPTRDMKSHYQSMGIPYWQRERLPFIFADRDLVFAAGVGVHGPFLEIGDHCVVLSWIAD